MVEVQFPDSQMPNSALEWFETWRRIRDEPDLSISGPGSESGASELVLLASCLASRELRGLKTRTDLPGDAMVTGSTTKSHKVLTTYYDDPISVSIRPRLLGSIHSLAMARAAADSLEKHLLSRVPTASPSVLRMARFVFEELGANVVQHSGRPETGFGWADIEPVTTQLQLAFADCGVGFRASLQRNQELKGRIQDDGEALQIALTPRISGAGIGQTNMGWGLKLLVDFSDLLGGDLYLASGDAMLVRKTIAAQRTNTLRTIPPWEGTLITISTRLMK